LEGIGNPFIIVFQRSPVQFDLRPQARPEPTSRRHEGRRATGPDLLRQPSLMINVRLRDLFAMVADALSGGFCASAKSKYAPLHLGPRGLANACAVASFECNILLKRISRN